MARHQLDCGTLYKTSQGYTFEGGTYDENQAWLTLRGWHYDIRQDAWIRDDSWPRLGPPSTIEHGPSTKGSPKP